MLIIKSKTAKNFSAAALTTIFTSLTSSAVLAQAPKIWTSWDYLSRLSMSQGQCMSESIKTVRDDMSFRENFEILESGVYGENGNYSVTTRCAEEQNFVFFITAGPSTEVAKGLLIDLKQKFTRPSNREFQVFSF
jgi:hypothetical protein